jgi:hypothetical protein
MMTQQAVMQRVAQEHPNRPVVKLADRIPARLAAMAAEWRKAGLPQWRVDLGIVQAMLGEERPCS